MQTKAIIYCRVSSKRQVKEGNGLESQEKRCRDYARSKGYQVLEVFRDGGQSGKLFDRLAMKDLLRYLDTIVDSSPENRIVVVFDDLKRFARDVEIHFNLKKEIYGRNGRVESPNFKFEDTPDGKFVETVMAAAAALERDQNRTQVLQKMKARMEMGYWSFMPPIGLRNEKDLIQGKILTPVEPHASLIKDAIEKYRDGILLTQEEVMKYLHRVYEIAGLQNRFALSTVQQILKNPLYAGYIEYKPWKIPFMKARHLGFISLNTYNAVQEKLQGRSKPWKRRDYSSDFPLRPHVLCTGCSKPMTASWNRGTGGKYPNYFCRTKGCIYNWKVISKYKIEPEFEILLSQSKPFDEYIDLAQDILKEQWNIRLQQNAETRARISMNVKATDAAIKSYLERIVKTTDEDMKTLYEEEIQKLRKTQKEGNQQLAKQKYTSQEFGTASEKVLGTLKKPVPMWKSDEYNDKRTILFMYFEEELRYDYKMGFGTTTLARPVELIKEIGSSKMPSVEMSSSELECR